MKLKCTKFDFGWGFAPDPTGGAHSALPDLLTGFYGDPTSRGREGRVRGKDGREGRDKIRRKKEERNEKGEKGRGKEKKPSKLEFLVTPLE